MRYRRKPVIFDAIQWTGENFNEIRAFVGQNTPLHQMGCDRLGIPTLEGVMTASLGDWIIMGTRGEFWPCKPNVFAATYEPEAPDA